MTGNSIQGNNPSFELTVLDLFASDDKRKASASITSSIHLR